MFCPNCGGKLEDNWNVCPNCGTSLKEKQESLVKEKNSGENQDNIIQEDRYLSQSDGVKKKTGILGKIFGWGLVVFNVFFAMLMFTESIVAGVCSLASAVLFCPKIWEKTNKKMICIILAIVMFFVAWSLALSGDSVDENKTATEQATEKEMDVTKSDSQTLGTNENEDMGEVDEDWENDVENTPSEFYPTDTVDCGDWEVTVWLAWTSTNSFLGDQEVNCMCDLTNKSGDEQTFYASSIFELDNNGLVDDASSDYDGQRIASGTTIRTTLCFSFPENANTGLALMKLDANGKNILFTAKPQSREKVNEFEGTYEGSGMKLVFMETSPGTYHTFDFNPLRGVEEYDISLDENNRFWIENAHYIWIQEESAIYLTDVDGNPDRESYNFIKSNLEEIKTIPREKVETGDLYFFSGGAELSLTKNGQTGTIIMFTLMDDNNAKIEFKGTFEYQDDMTKLVSIKVDSEYSDYANEKIAFPDGIDGGLIVLSEDTIDNGMEFLKE